MAATALGNDQSRLSQALRIAIENKDGEHALQVKIPEATLIADNFAAYRIELTCGHDCFSVFRRYSSIKKLHTRLGRKAPTLLEVLRFPKKKWFGNRTPHFLEKRRAQLEIYLQMLLSSNLIGLEPIRRCIFEFLSDSDPIIKNNRLLDTISRRQSLNS